MLKLDPPEKLDFSKPQEWPNWKQRFDRFRCATKPNKETEELQINALIYTMGKEAEHIFNAFTFEEGDEKKYGVVLNKFEGHFGRSEILFMSEHVFIGEYRRMEKLSKPLFETSTN